MKSSQAASLDFVADGVNGGRPDRATLREEQTQLTRRRILEGARRLFVKHGYSTVSMQEIAREAGVAYQTLSRSSVASSISPSNCAPPSSRTSGKP